MKSFSKILILTLLLFSCRSTNDIDKFDSLIGEEKATAFNNVLNSFDEFLLLNFQQEQSQNTRIKAFLKYFSKNNKPDSNWLFETHKNLEIYNSLESSRMRLEIICNGWEFDYYFDSVMSTLPQIYGIDSIELVEEIVIEEEDLSTEEEQKAWQVRDSLNQIRIKNMYRINPYGKYIEGIELIADDDPGILGYIQAIRTGSKISDLSSLANAFLDNVDNFNSPLMKRIIVVEFYLKLMTNALNENNDMPTKGKIHAAS